MIHKPRPEEYTPFLMACGSFTESCCRAPNLPPLSSIHNPRPEENGEYTPFLMACCSFSEPCCRSPNLPPLSTTTKV